MALQTANSPVVAGQSDLGAPAVFRRVIRHTRDHAHAYALWVPTGLFLFIVFMCFFGRTIFNLPPASYGNILDANLPFFSPGHLLGTDPLGDDLLARTLVGGQVSITVGLGATVIGVLIGSNLGVAAGFFGGAVDSIICRILDVFLAFPALILALTVAAYLGPSESHEMLAIAFFTVPNYARLSRAAALRIRGREFILIGPIMGARPRNVCLRHVYPNILPTLTTIFPITVAAAMLIEAALSFLGLGVRPPLPSWGNMIAAGQTYIVTHPTNIIVPGVCLFLTVLTLSLIGDQIRIRLGRQ
jgi:peptide/nickel transport system permease protein